jgi:hypothetical protein
MPKHQIMIELPAKAVLNTDVRVVVWGDETKLGELNLSKGTIDWKPARRRRPVRLSWERFAAIMDEL